MLKKFLFLACMAVFALTMGGCGVFCPVTKLNVSVQVDESFRQQWGNRPVQVDIVGVGPVEHKRWETYSMTKYWESGDTLRATSASTIVTLTIDPSKPEPQVVWADNAMWSKWMEGSNPNSAPHIYVLVQLPGNHPSSEDKPGNMDARRQILPTGACRWENSAGHPPTVKLVLKADRIVTETQPKLDKNAQ